VTRGTIQVKIQTPVGLEISTVRNHPDTNSSFYLEATFASIGFKFPKRDAYRSPFRTRNKAGATGLWRQPLSAGTRVQVIALAVAGDFRLDNTKPGCVKT
jgi:hypothetical protein